MYGLGGNDTYFVDNPGDIVGEAAGGGTDRVLTSVSYTLTAGQEIEALSTTNPAGVGAINLTGNAFAQTITGNAGANVINGGGGNDVMQGLGGNDRLNGGAGADSLDGGAGEDTASYAGSPAAVIVNLTTGTGSGGDAQGDTLLNIEDLLGSGFGDTLIGNAGANVINGAGGADIMQGLGGNDTYFVDNVGDIVKELAGGGNDQVLTSVSYTLTAGQEIEALSTTNPAGVGAINLTGNAFAQTITGNDGANVIDGSGGADIMQGLGGNDTYFVDNPGDIVNELVGGGTDRVLTSVSYALIAGQEIEALSTTNNAGVGAINLTGNAFAQTITGNAGANVIDGGAGNDTLDGLGGVDQFKFDTLLNPLTNVDSILDFAAGTDKIDLAHTIFSSLSAGTLSSSAFFVGAAAQNATEHVIYNPGTGGLFYDPDGNGAAAATEFAKLSAGLALHHTDFTVV
jgi:serralysin